jgi:hypothetical protein
MAADDCCKTKLVHVIPFDDDAAIFVEPATKRFKIGCRKSPGSLTSLEHEGLQALLTLSSPIKSLAVEFDHGYETELIRFSEPLKTDLPKAVVSQVHPSTKNTGTFTKNAGPAQRNRAVSNLFKGIMRKPLLPPPTPPPLRYLGRPLAPPPSLPRISYGCIFSKRERDSINKPHV